MDDQDAVAASTCSVRAHATPDEVAKWMTERMQQAGRLSQRRAAREIAERFGESFVYLNDNGHTAIAKEVLAAFRATGTAFWVARARYWRPRTEEDVTGPRQK
jgi:hypothetical protein